MAHDLILGKTDRNWSLGSDDPLVWTPSAIQAERLRILGVFDTVNVEVSQAVLDGKISQSEWQQWNQIYKSSHAFLTSASNLWGSNVKVAQKHEDLALKWHDFIKFKGGKLQGPANPGRDKNDNLVFDKWTAALLVGGVASSALLITALRKK